MVLEVIYQGGQKDRFSGAGEAGNGDMPTAG
jgi:hypothetical protein